jgi:Flp pilus assembly protein TadD
MAEGSAGVDRLVDRALDCMAAGDAAGAVPLLRKAREVAPEHPAASHALLRALEDAGRLDEALELVRELIAAEPDEALLETRLSILLQKAGDVPGAEAASARARVLEWKRQLREQPE